MFEKARELLLALQIEAIQNCCNNNNIMLLAHHVVGKSPEKNGCNNNDPMLLGTEIFCAVLR